MHYLLLLPLKTSSPANGDGPNAGWCWWCSWCGKHRRPALSSSKGARGDVVVAPCGKYGIAPGWHYLALVVVQRANTAPHALNQVAGLQGCDAALEAGMAGLQRPELQPGHTQQPDREDDQGHQNFYQRKPCCAAGALAGVGAWFRQHATSPETILLLPLIDMQTLRLAPGPEATARSNCVSVCPKSVPVVL